MTPRRNNTGTNNMLRGAAQTALATGLLALSAASNAHLATINYVANIGADSLAAVETYLESTTGMDAIIVSYGTLDWATNGTGTGVSTQGSVSIVVPQASDLDADGLPHYGIWEYSQAFPPTINYQVVSFDAGSPIGVQYALYAHNEPGNDIFSAGFFQTDDFADGAGPHGWTDFSLYSVVLSPWNNGDLAPRGAPDGEVTTGDSFLCQQILLKMITPTLDEVEHGDVHPMGAPDGVITAEDCLLIQQTALLQ